MDRLADLQQLTADFAKIKRVPPLADNGTPENDVEHSFGLAITCWYLLPKIAPELDLLKVLRYALAHDIVEIHAGDTYSFDVEAVKTKESRERAALDILKTDWSDFPEITTAAEGYMNKESDEARFVKAVDKLLPVIMFELTNDPAQAWKERSIGLTMEIESKKSIHVSPIMSPYYDMLIEWLDARDNIPKN
jgi:putative hydrolase of HD superfamily